MKMRRISSGGILGLIFCLASVGASASHFVAPSDVAWESLLSGPPAAGSDVEKQEIATLLEWQNKRTATDVARCKSEETVDPFIFSSVLGEKFTEKSLPVTAKLLRDAQADIKPITRLAKKKWPRNRPPATDARIQTCVTPETTGSYPSAHTVRGVVWANMLAMIFPDKKAQLLARGKLMGADRVIAGIHFPSDVEAGQKLGDAIFEKMAASPTFNAEMNAAKAECAEAQIGK